MQRMMIKDLNDKNYRDMKEYCVEFNYNCCSHYTVEAMNEDEAIEKASELDRRLTKTEWYNNLDIELDDTQVWEEGQ